MYSVAADTTMAGKHVKLGLRRLLWRNLYSECLTRV